MPISVEKISIDSHSHSGPENIFSCWFVLLEYTECEESTLLLVCYISQADKPLPGTMWPLFSEFWPGEESQSDTFLLHTFVLPAKNSCEINKGHLQLSSVLCLNEDDQNCIYCNFDTILSRN